MHEPSFQVPVPRLNLSQTLHSRRNSVLSGCQTPRERDPLIDEEKKWKRCGYKCTKLSDRNQKTARHRRSNTIASTTIFTFKVELHCLSGILRYKGEVYDYKKSGNGEEFWDNGKTKYSGILKNDLYEDEIAKLYYKSGRLEYQGGFSEGNLYQFYNK